MTYKKGTTHSKPVKPDCLKLDSKDLAVIGYSDATLPWGECRVYSVDDARDRLEEIKGLYKPVI